MASVTMELPDDKAAELQAKLAAQGLTIEEWVRKMVTQDEPATEAMQQKQAAAARIREVQKRTKPDPEGWIVKDYIDYGRR